MAVGSITAPMPNLVKPEMVIAEKVAAIASPAASNTMWDKLAGSLSPTAVKMSGGYAAATPSGPVTSKLMGLSKSLSLGNERYSSDMPHLQGPPKKGIGTAMQKVHGTTDQEVSGGVGSGAAKGNTVFVDDKNFPVTLKEIIGSRMLTQEQLKAASIDNIKKLFNVGLNNTRHQGSSSVGTSKENEELFYMAQRMVLEGFVRGVDITKELKKQGGLNIAIRDVSFNKNPNRNLGLNSSGAGMDSINFNAKFWRSANEMEKYTLFMHELGHGLLNRPELGSELKYDIMGDGPRGIAKKLMSSKETYNAILNDHFGSATNKGDIAIGKLKNGQGTADFDPSWFPQLSGEAVKIGGSAYNPGNSAEAGEDPGKDNKAYNAEFNAMFEQFRTGNQAQLDAMSRAMNDNFAQQNQMMQQQTHLNSINSIAGPSATPMMQSMGGPQMMGPAQMGSASIGNMGGGGYEGTKAFAAGIANLDGGGSDMSNAGMLLASG